MPPPRNPPLPKTAAAPRRTPAWGDAWNSSSTGHQRPESNPGTEWRDSRNRKLASQFRAGDGSGGAGAEDRDEQRKAPTPRGGVREQRGQSVASMLFRPGQTRRSLARQSGSAEKAGGEGEPLALGLAGEEAVAEARGGEEEGKEARAGPRSLFDGVVVYVNGSTFPLVSDHKLKQILSEHGGQMSLNLGRRKVTHVILGRPNGLGQGAGGGLAAGKIEREIKRVGGCGVKYVGVEWVLESLKAGKRLPEARFSNLKTAAKGQGSAYGFFSKHRGSGATGAQSAKQP